MYVHTVLFALNKCAGAHSWTAGKDKNENKLVLFFHPVMTLLQGQQQIRSVFHQPLNS